MPKVVNMVWLTGDGEAATDAWFKTPRDVAVDISGSNIYFTADNRVRKVDLGSGIIETLAGTGTNALSGDGEPSTGAGLARPIGIAVDDQGNVYFADSYNQRVRRIDAATGIITTVAGIGHFPPATHPDPSYVIKPTGQGFSGDGGPGTTAMLSTPSDVTIGPSGNLYIADTGNDKIRKLDLVTGIITTFADGGAVRGEKMEVEGGGGEWTMTFTNFAPPVSVAVNDQGHVYVADYDQNIVVRIVP